jgi:hypothetical protein
MDRGEFVHARKDGGKWVAIGAPFRRINFSAYDGVLIHQQNGTALVPNGEVDHPFDAQHGKRTTYDMGVVRREVTY